MHSVQHTRTPIGRYVPGSVTLEKPCRSMALGLWMRLVGSEVTQYLGDRCNWETIGQPTECRIGPVVGYLEREANKLFGINSDVLVGVVGLFQLD
jgi:hypothetical protein